MHTYTECFVFCDGSIKVSNGHNTHKHVVCMQRNALRHRVDNAAHNVGIVTVANLTIRLHPNVGHTCKCQPSRHSFLICDHRKRYVYAHCLPNFLGIFVKIIVNSIAYVEIKCQSKDWNRNLLLLMQDVWFMWYCLWTMCVPWATWPCASIAMCSRCHWPVLRVEHFLLVISINVFFSFCFSFDCRNQDDYSSSSPTKHHQEANEEIHSPSIRPICKTLRKYHHET